MAEEQRTTKQHPIPQQVLGMKFKLVGDLTLKQFGYLAGFGLLAYITFISPLFILLRIPLALFFFLAGVALALVPVNDQPLEEWISGLFRAIYAPTRWIWQKTAKPPEFLTLPTAELARPVEEGVSPEEAQRRLEEYIATIKEEKALEPIDLAEEQQLATINMELQEALPTLTPSVTPPLVSPPPQAEEPAPPVLPTPWKPTLPVEKVGKVVEPPTKPEKPIPPPIAPTPKAPIPLLPQRRYERVTEEPSFASTINYAAEPVFKLQRGKSITYVTALRNVRVGRKVRAVPAAEVVFAPARERVVTVKERPLPDLQPVVSEVEPPLPPTPPTPPEPTTDEPLSPPEPIKKPPTPQKLTPPQPAEEPPPEVKKPVLPKLRVKPLPPALFTKPGAPAQKTNIISGVIRNEKSEIIPGMLVIIKDSLKTTVCATKTDRLGHFTFSHLANGHYTIEFPRAERSFAIMEIDLTGEIVPPLEVKPENKG